ncbi:MAG TPA: SEL1-like repeat protein, partial [Niastella sp.]
MSLIKATNDCIQAAIDADDPELLNECPGVRNNPYGFSSFWQLFSHSAYGYGWEVIKSVYFEEEEDPEEEIIFIENGLEGLKKKDGTVIIPAQYDEVYSFPENETFAVVKRGGKYGYVNREGQLVTGLIYDDAYDVLNGYGRVQIDAQHYLVQPGAELPSTSYDELRVISEEAQWYTVTQGETKSVINAAGQTLLPFVPCEVYMVGTYNGRPLMRITDEIKKGRKTLPFHGLVTAEGKTVLEVGYLEIWPAYDDVVTVKAKDLMGMYSVQNGWVIEMEYDRIDPFLGKVYVLEKDGKQGLYISAQKLVAPIYDIIISDVNWLDELRWETFATNDNGIFRIDHQGKATPLTGKEIEGLLAENNRYRYNETELTSLINAAGENIPAEMLYANGFEALSAQDYDEAIRNYERAAAKGSANAMNDLGYIYEAIEGYVDSKLSFKWYSRGVELGSPHAANGLANCYMDGLGTTADINKAIELYEQSAAGGVQYGHYNLGILYYEARHVEQNYEKALTHFEAASNLGFECHNYVGVLL